MSLRRVALICLYDQACLGARSLAASALQAGHTVRLINLKMFRQKFLPHESSSTELEQLRATGFRPVVEVQSHGDVVCPYPFEITERERELFWSELARLQPDVIGFSLTSVVVPLAQEFAQEIRVRFPNARLIVGGIHATLDPAGCLEWADAVCVGEGEGALLEYLDDPTRTDIANLWTSAAQNPVRPLIQDLDSMPLPLYVEHNVVIEDDRACALMDLPKVVLADIPVISSTRGCPFGCSYCLHGNVREMYRGQKYARRQSVDRFLHDLQWYKRHFPITGFNLWDDVFMIGRAWIDEFCEKYPRVFPNFPFAGYAHPTTCDLDMLKKLKKAGCIAVSLGLQTGSDRLNREVYRRNTPMSEFVRLGHEIVEAGYEQIVYDVMSRCEFETEEDCLATVDLLAQMPKASRINAKHLTVYPFAPIGQLQLPRTQMTPQDFRFYEFLYLLAGMPGFDVRLLPALAESKSLRENPDVLREVLLESAPLYDELALLRHQMPWGVRCAAGHLFSQIREAVRRRLR